MLICHCHGITDQRIRQLARRCEQSFRRIARECGAGTTCGGCLLAIREILADERRTEALESHEALGGDEATSPALSAAASGS